MLRCCFIRIRNIVEASVQIFDSFTFSAKIKKKMLYSSSFDALKKCLVGVQKYIQVKLFSVNYYLLFTNLFPQATDESEASEEEVENQLRKMDRV